MNNEIRYNNFEILLVVFMPNVTTNPTITYTNHLYPSRNVSFFIFLYAHFEVTLETVLGGISNDFLHSL